MIVGLEVDLIIMDAINEAGLLHQTYLGSEHLLLAILKNEKLQITKLLNEYGMTYKNVRLDLLELNYYFGKMSQQSGYSQAVINIIANCDTSSSMIVELMSSQDTLANSLLKRYAIPIEKVVN
ncbi:MAG: Clp protease N-terminal domain-containing protein [Bacilli bacterium]|nr:Clp protease N-terminal domain-containing protein [Bacilli bacterium]